MEIIAPQLGILSDEQRRQLWGKFYPRQELDPEQEIDWVKVPDTDEWESKLLIAQHLATLQAILQRIMAIREEAELHYSDSRWTRGYLAAIDSIISHIRGS